MRSRKQTPARRLAGLYPGTGAHCIWSHSIPDYYFAGRLFYNL
ncbi:hypothetical protein MJC1_00019 [Methylocystis sp. MJC1]|nr:hypothetical protein MJC1_00019 [Methylocystis sp. MJC1]